MFATICALVALLAHAPRASVPSAAGDGFDFAALGKRFLESTGDAAGSFDDLLSGPAFCRVELGSFDLVVPRESLADSDVAGDFERAAGVLIDLQETWFDWRRGRGGDDASSSDPLAGDWKALRKWVGSWSSSKLRRLQGGPSTLYDELGAKEEVLEAQARLRASTRPAEEVIEYAGERSVLVLAPTREHFLQLVGAGGLLEPSSQETLWTPQTLAMAGTWVGWNLLVAMEYPAEVPDPSEPFAGRPIAEREASELMQHVADRAAALLLRKEFHRHGTHFLEAALGANLVIAVVGKNDLEAGDWMMEHRTAGAKTKAYARFVPGGNSGGGSLPPRKARAGPTSFTGTATPRYRADGGEGFFEDVLRDGQRQGAKLAPKDHPAARNKAAHFVLTTPNGKAVVSAPFLGDAAQGKELPPHEYLDDYEDLFRAYRSLFLHWLRTRGAGSPEASAERFGALIEAQIQRDRDAPRDPIFRDVYGVPLSAADDSVDSLEWRFLEWLRKGK